MPGSIISGIFGNKAAKTQAKSAEEAAGTTLEGTLAAIESQEGMFERAIELGEPWRTAGQGALGALSYELGLGELPTLGGSTSYNVGGETGFRVGTNEFDTRAAAENFAKAIPGTPAREEWTPGEIIKSKEGWYSEPSYMKQIPAIAGRDALSIEESTTGGAGTDGFAYTGFQKTPGYEFQLDEGQRAINRSLAARGKLLSGPAVKEGLRFSQGLADQTYANHLSRLANMAGLGANVAGAGGTAAVATGQGIASSQMAGAAGVANAQIQAGNARASGYAATGQAISGGFNFLGSLAGAFM